MEGQHNNGAAQIARQNAFRTTRLECLAVIKNLVPQTRNRTKAVLQLRLAPELSVISAHMSVCKGVCMCVRVRRVRESLATASAAPVQ